MSDEVVGQPYPACRYHPTKAAVVVKSQEEDDALGPMWVDTPEKAENLKTAGKAKILPGEIDLGPDKPEKPELPDKPDGPGKRKS
jgi:hypothetical protein